MPRRGIDYAGLMQVDAYAGFNRLYEAGRTPVPIVEAACRAPTPQTQAVG